MFWSYLPYVAILSYSFFPYYLERKNLYLTILMYLLGTFSTVFATVLWS